MRKDVAIVDFWTASPEVWNRDPSAALDDAFVAQHPGKGV